MKFAHLADCHIGGWREEELRKLNMESFRQAVKTCIKKNVGFVLIAGDLFNTALPSIDTVKDVAGEINKLKQEDIDCYIIPGSHDFSPSGKTMLDVLEKAGLVTNVFKKKYKKLIFTIDKTNTKLVGVLGRRGGLDKLDYIDINKKELEEESGFKIFLFHNLLTEFKTEEFEKMKSLPLSALPKNFNYYAGGHPHFILDKKYDNGIIAYPGALFPNNFKELEKFKHGGFYIVETNNKKLDLKYIPVKLKEVISFNINADNLTPEEAEERIRNKLNQDLKDKIVTLRVEGTLKSGRPSDIHFKNIISNVDCHILLKNISKLTSKDFEEINIETGNIEEVESKIIKENLSKSLENEENITEELIKVFSEEKNEAEKKADFEKRIINDILEVLK